MIYLFSMVGLLAPQNLHWIFQDFMFMVAISIFIAYKLFHKFSLAIGLLYLFSMVSGLFIIFFTPLTHYQIYSVEVKNMACIHIGLSLLWITFFSLFFLLIPKKLNQSLLYMFVALALIDQFIMSFHQHYWIMGNHATDASFLACTLPFVLHFTRSWFWIILVFFILLEILASKSVTGISAVGVMILVLALCEYGLESLKITIPVLIVGFILAYEFMQAYHSTGIIAGNNSLFNDNGRFHIWQISWDYFWRNFQPYLGSGPGTFYTWGPRVQSSTPELDGGIFFWVHNDWLQCFLETGIIGISLIIGIFISALINLRKSPYFFTSLFVFGYISITQFPLRQPISALFCGWLLFNAFSKEDRIVLQ